MLSVLHLNVHFLSIISLGEKKVLLFFDKKIIIDNIILLILTLIVDNRKEKTREALQNLIF